MIPVALNLKDKNVVIIGGGNVAYRQAKKFLSDYAHITIVSPNILDKFENLDVKYIKDVYQENYIKDAFLVYAATNQRSVNQQIVNDCNQLGILCGSAIRLDDVSFYGMAYREDETGMLAYSAHQRFPYIAPFLDDMMDYVEGKKERLSLCKQLRPYVVELNADTKELLNKLYQVPIDILHFLVDSCKLGEGWLFIHHDHKYDQNVSFSIKPSICMSEMMLEQYRDCFCFDVTYHVIPLVLFKGRIYSRMVGILDDSFDVKAPIIESKEDVVSLYNLLRTDKKDIWILHKRQSQQLFDLIKESKIDVQICLLDEPLPLEKDKRYSVTLLLTSQGKHYHDSIHLINHYQMQGFDIVCQGNLLDSKDVRDYIINK